MNQPAQRSLAQRWFADKRVLRIAQAGTRRVLAETLAALGADPDDEHPVIVHKNAKTGLLGITPPADHTHYRVQIAHKLSGILDTHVSSTHIAVVESHGDFEIAIKL